MPSLYDQKTGEDFNYALLHKLVPTNNSYEVSDLGKSPLKQLALQNQASTTVYAIALNGTGITPYFPSFLGTKLKNTIKSSTAKINIMGTIYAATWNLISILNSTLLSTDHYTHELKNEFLHIIKTSPTDVDIYEEEDIFSNRIIQWINKDKNKSINILLEFLEKDLLNDDVISKILTNLGLINDFETYTLRKSILLNYLNDNSNTIRYASIIGLSRLNTHDIIVDLKKRLDIEKLPAFRGTLKSIIQQQYEI